MSEDYESDGRTHASGCGERYHCNVDKMECIVEENPLEESCEMFVHEVSPLCLEIVDYMFPNPIDFIHALLTCSPYVPSLKHEFLKSVDSFVNNDANVLCERRLISYA